MRIVFAGTPDFSVPALDALVAAGHEIAAVYTQPDRPAGRGRKLAASPVKQRALALGIPVEQPQSLKTSDAQSTLRAYEPDVMVVVAYGLLLPQAVLDIPRLGCINIHASLLPRWRGAAPIQRAIAAGDTESGVSIMQMEKGLDTGPVLMERRLPIAAGETGGSLHDKLAGLGGEAIVETLAALEADRVTPQRQDDAQASYAHKLSKAEAEIDWSCPATDIERQVRAFNPWPVAFTHLDGEPLRIWSATANAEAESGDPGRILNASAAGVVVATGKGALCITSLQPAGKRPMSAAQFLNGHPLSPDDRMGR